MARRPSHEPLVPQETHTVSVRMSSPLYRQLDEMAWSLRTSMSQLIVEGVRLRLGLPDAELPPDPLLVDSPVETTLQNQTGLPLSPGRASSVNSVPDPGSPVAAPATAPAPMSTPDTAPGARSGYPKQMQCMKHGVWMKNRYKGECPQCARDRAQRNATKHKMREKHTDLGQG